MSEGRVVGVPQRRASLRRASVRLALAFGVAGAGLGCGAASDSAAPLEKPAPAPPVAYERPAYERVSDTGIYADLGANLVARGFEAFTPSYPLFADGAEKRRFVSLPPGSTIDTSDLDHWVFAVGTRFVKEFWLDGVLLETRLVERYGDGANDYFMGAFVWSEDGSDAALAPNGAEDVLGTAHDAPAQKQCTACHNGEAGRVLGFSALQLAHAKSDAAELTLATLVARRTLSDAPATLDFQAPGDGATAAALGYLHGNCGHCHNLHGTSWPDTQMVLRLDVEETVADQTALFRSVVGAKVQYFRGADVHLRVAPGDPNASALVVRMQARGSDEQMPPLATEIPDAVGVAAVSAWITSLGE